MQFACICLHIYLFVCTLLNPKLFLSCPSHCGLLSFVESSSPSFQVFFRNNPYEAVGLVCLWEEVIQIFLHGHLLLYSQLCFFLQDCLDDSSIWILGSTCNFCKEVSWGLDKDCVNSIDQKIWECAIPWKTLPSSPWSWDL